MLVLIKALVEYLFLSGLLSLACWACIQLFQSDMVDIDHRFSNWFWVSILIAEFFPVVITCAALIKNLAILLDTSL